MIRVASLALIVAACHGREAEPRATPTPSAPAGSGLDGDAPRGLGVEVPRLANDAVTLPPGTDPIVAIRDMAGIHHFEVVPMFAIERGLPALAVLNALRTHGAGDIRLVVIAGGVQRQVEIEAPAATTGELTSMPLLHVAPQSLTVNGLSAAPNELRAKLASAEGVMLELDPDVTMQRLAEVVSGAGGRLVLMPVQRAPLPPKRSR
jgi:hypothetical protein